MRELYHLVTVWNKSVLFLSSIALFTQFFELSYSLIFAVKKSLKKHYFFIWPLPRFRMKILIIDWVKRERGRRSFSEVKIPIWERFVRGKKGRNWDTGLSRCGGKSRRLRKTTARENSQKLLARDPARHCKLRRHTLTPPNSDTQTFIYICYTYI